MQAILLIVLLHSAFAQQSEEEHQSCDFASSMVRDFNQLHLELRDQDVRAMESQLLEMRQIVQSAVDHFSATEERIATTNAATEERIATANAASEERIATKNAALVDRLENMTRVGVSCKELRSRGHSVSGLYTIWSLDTGDVRVYCDMVTDGGGWLVFQRRKDGNQDFFLTWAEYAAGFGDLHGEFWLGNRNLHALTAKQPHELRIDFKDNGDAAFAKYSIFKVGPESDEFRLEIRGYSGDAGDTMGYHNGMKFSAKDQDHDTWSGGDCANKYKGGWWYYYCHDANLNGLYLNGAYTGYTRGIDWSKWKGYHYSIQFTEMKIRPID